MSTVVMLDTLESSGLEIYGHRPNDLAGRSISDVGDVNNDGFDDFIIGAPQVSIESAREGSAYLIYGGPTGMGEIDVTNLTDAQGFRIDGHDFFDMVGSTVSGAGDVNGDGFDDLLVSAVFGNVVGYFYDFSLPSAYVIYGGDTRSGAIDVTTLAPSDGFAINASYRYGLHPLAVSEAGDVNNDGYDDIVIGSTYGSVADAAYVVFGREGGYASVDLANLGLSGFAINGADDFDGLGASVSAAGDINGDHFADIIIGAPREDGGGADAGAAYVLFGHDGAFGTIDLATLSATAGFVIQGGDAQDFAGSSVSSADFNGDGYSDLIVGAPLNDTGGTDAGQAYVIYGHAGAFPAVVDLLNLGTSGLTIQGGPNDRLGLVVSGAGDVNGDGFDDLLIGSLSTDSFLIYGRAGAFGTVDVQNLQSSAGIVLQGSTAQGWEVSAAGDVNDDGLDDILIGSPNNDHNGENAGAAYLLFGQSSAIPDVRDDFNGDGFSDLLWRNDDGRVITLLGAPNRSFVGNVSFNLNPGLDWHIEGTGDFNGDHFDDILWRNDAGDVVTLLGEAGGSFIGNVNFQLNPGLDWHIEGTGDFNGDGFDDILWRNDAGNVVTLLGEAGGSFIGNVNFSLNPGLDWHIAGTGDFNGDGRDDILWRSDAGDVVTLLGQLNGSFVGNVNFDLNPGLDWHIVGTGDFNGDGRDDILWRSDDGRITDLLGQQNGSFIGNVANLNINPGSNSEIVAIGDYNSDTRDDIVLRDGSGNTIDWLGLENGGFFDNSATFNLNPGTDWQVQPELSLGL